MQPCRRRGTSSQVDTVLTFERLARARGHAPDLDHLGYAVLREPALQLELGTLEGVGALVRRGVGGDHPQHVPQLSRALGVGLLHALRHAAAVADHVHGRPRQRRHQLLELEAGIEPPLFAGPAGPAQRAQDAHAQRPQPGVGVAPEVGAPRVAPRHLRKPAQVEHAGVPDGPLEGVQDVGDEAVQRPDVDPRDELRLPQGALQHADEALHELREDVVAAEPGEEPRAGRRLGGRVPEQARRHGGLAASTSLQSEAVVEVGAAQAVHGSGCVLHLAQHPLEARVQEQRRLGDALDREPAGAVTDLEDPVVPEPHVPAVLELQCNVRPVVRLTLEDGWIGELTPCCQGVSAIDRDVYDPLAPILDAKKEAWCP
mmetsp:Transcript_53596/g.156217  ORF Transcript_53596/g.156217 Transcript_53596/m.156217 type:complete len:372 (+) Transcript_53596:295-1410(+)